MTEASTTCSACRRTSRRPSQGSCACVSPSATEPGARANVMAEAPPASPEAYRLYLLGRQQLARRGEESLEAAIGLLEQATAADPAFLRARLALAWASTLLASSSPAHAEEAAIRVDRELAAIARETAMSGEIDAVRAWLELDRNRWIEAETAFRAALAADSRRDRAAGCCIRRCRAPWATATRRTRKRTRR